MNRFLLLSMMAASLANADIIPTFVDITPDGANFNWNYQVDVTLDAKVVTGSYFTLYDFPGVIGAAAPSGWAYSLQPTGITPAMTLPIDTELTNVTFSRTGDTIFGQASLGIFTVVSTQGPPGDSSSFTSETVRSGGSLTNTPLMNIGRYVIPGDGTVPLEPIDEIPEPSTVILMGSGLLAAAFARQRFIK